MPESTQWREALTQPYAFHPAAAMRRDFSIVDSDDIDLIIRFIADESKGMGHGRLRARLCRLLKHVELSSGQRRRLGHVIGQRLCSGRFSEQFFCQLRALARIDHAQLVYWCERALVSPAPLHVQRFAIRALRLPGTPVLKQKHATMAMSRNVRARWVPAAARAAKAMADEAGQSLYSTLWTSADGKRVWDRLRRSNRSMCVDDLLADYAALRAAACRLDDARARLQQVLAYSRSTG